MEEPKGEQVGKNKDTFIRPKARQRANRKRPIRTGAAQGNTSNAFEILEMETESEEKNKEPNNDEGNKETTDHTTKGGEEHLHNAVVHLQGLTEGLDEDVDMLISDVGSEEMELNEVLEQEGVNLPVMVENWKTQGIENISEE